MNAQNIAPMRLYAGMHVEPFRSTRPRVQLLVNEEGDQITGATAFLTTNSSGEPRLSDDLRGLKLIMDRLSMSNVYQAWQLVWDSINDRQYAFLLNNQKVTGTAINAIPQVNLTQKGILVDEYPKNWRQLSIEPGNTFFDNYLYPWKKFEWARHFTELWCEQSLKFVTLERESASGKSWVVATEWEPVSTNPDELRIA